ncbi:ABC transporter permease [Desulfocurvibacter africanus]|uniref:Transport permease protein n=1 Tax=Desulfocurvibacter africanus subsp. africanus str. Walvis Bay TaxID=690850 RepID=F3YZ31_DESAF|nr:ABC transporter permease [Desulfocurvibacter africanus]EGJ49676.1 ABC-2 type transporter [Desulfocurvibacter africanus subsp. africanus str. Walvis Bay]
MTGNLSLRLFRVWWRNLVVYKRIWQVNFLVPLLEPAFYILAFGLGFSGMIGNVEYAGLSLTYTEFIAPALVATAVMYNSFFETTYTSFVRMYYQKTFDAMLATPLSLEEVITAEIVWSASKAAAAVAIMLLVLMPLGYVAFPSGLLLIPLAFLGGLAFGSIGMFFTGITPSIDMFNLPTFLFITPMFLFSGTFFPISGLPGWAQAASLAFPLYHLVELCRLLSLRASESSPLINLAYLLGFTLLFGLLGLRTMRRRLIR